MKRLCLLLVLTVSAVLVAQQEPAAPKPPISNMTSNLVERPAAPTYSDQYCAGFLSKEAYNHANIIVGGLNSPAATQFAQGDTIFLDGSGYTEGQRFSIIRELRDPNRVPAFEGQPAAVAAVGTQYQELGRVRITALRGKNAVALVEFSCTAMVPGDIVVPFQEKQPVTYRNSKETMDRFPSDPGGLNGRIIMAKEFDAIVATGHKVYLDVGASQGVKVGDYFRIVRAYDPAKMEKIDALAYKAQQTEDTQKVKRPIPNARYAEMPKRAIGEMIVLAVTPTSATAMVTLALEGINVGDRVELEGTAAKE